MSTSTSSARHVHQKHQHLPRLQHLLHHGHHHTHGHHLRPAGSTLTSYSHSTSQSPSPSPSPAPPSTDLSITTTLTKGAPTSTAASSASYGCCRVKSPAPPASTVGTDLDDDEGFSQIQLTVYPPAIDIDAVGCKSKHLDPPQEAPPPVSAGEVYYVPNTPLVESIPVGRYQLSSSAGSEARYGGEKMPSEILDEAVWRVAKLLGMLPSYPTAPDQHPAIRNAGKSFVRRVERLVDGFGLDRVVFALDGPNVGSHNYARHPGQMEFQCLIDADITGVVSAGAGVMVTEQTPVDMLLVLSKLIEAAEVLETAGTPQAVIRRDSQGQVISVSMATALAHAYLDILHITFVPALEALLEADANGSSVGGPSLSYSCSTTPEPTSLMGPPSSYACACCSPTPNNTLFPALDAIPDATDTDAESDDETTMDIRHASSIMSDYPPLPTPNIRPSSYIPPSAPRELPEGVEQPGGTLTRSSGIGYSAFLQQQQQTQAVIQSTSPPGTANAPTATSSHAKNTATASANGSGSGNNKEIRGPSHRDSSATAETTATGDTFVYIARSMRYAREQEPGISEEEHGVNRPYGGSEDQIGGAGARGKKSSDGGGGGWCSWFKCGK
ncbi:hypothetical protein DFH27DRAFT_90957 [Peziza echinospora]|nr:hypothetical protein DFH27DRAFT_90957 [Peziza echinospora]